MVSGEEVSINIKDKTAITLTWKVPGWLAGNEYGKWIDASGSIRRRIIPIDFNRAIPSEQSDPQLFKKFLKSIENLYAKSVAYLVKCHEHGQKDIWKKGILSKQIEEFANNLRTRVDALEGFIQDRYTSGLRLSSDYSNGPNKNFNDIVFMRERDFKTKYLDYRRHHSFPIVNLDDDHFALVFQLYGLHWSRRRKMIVNGKNVEGNWVIGICEETKPHPEV